MAAGSSDDEFRAGSSASSDRTAEADEPTGNPLAVLADLSNADQTSRGASRAIFSPSARAGDPRHFDPFP